jgi:hypothetical protein
MATIAQLHASNCSQAAQNEKGLAASSETGFAAAS